MKNTRQKFMHYAFEIFIYSFGLSTLGLIVFSIVHAYQHIH